MTEKPKIEALLLDLDGTVYRGREAVPGAADFIARLRDESLPFLYVTNRANRTPETICRFLQDMAIPSLPEDVLTSAQVAARMLAGQRVFCVGEEGLTRALADEGATITEESPATVVVGLDSKITYEKLTKAVRFILGGAAFVATNTDRVVNEDGGLSPGAGTLVAAIAYASGQEPLVVGKPERPIMDQAVERLGARHATTLMVGDNPETDIAAAAAAGTLSALILTGVTDRAGAALLRPAPDFIVEDFDELTRLVFG